MDLKHGKSDAKRKKVEDRDTNKRDKATEDAGEPFPKRILRFASKRLPHASLPAVEVKKQKGKAASTSRKPKANVTPSKDNAFEKNSMTSETAKPNSSKSKEFSEPTNTDKAKKPAALPNPTTQTVTETNATLSSKNNTPVRKELIFHEELPKTKDHFSSLDTTTGESTQGRKNPMLLGPVIRCIFGFLDIENVKNCRLISREWGSVGKQALTNRALIYFDECCQPSDFYSCFLDSAALFSSFKFDEGSRTIEELSKFFDQQRKSIKELKIREYKLSKDGVIVNNFDISPWISKSAMVKSEVKYLTKLSIYEVDCAIPLSLLKDIKDLSLSYCRVNVEAGIQIQPVKLSLQYIDFYQDETLSSIQINDIVKLSSAKEMYLHGFTNETYKTEMEIDLSGNCSLEFLALQTIETFNWETSKWNIGHMQFNNVELPASQMTIKELYLAAEQGSHLDLFALPVSIENLGIGESSDGQDVDIICSEPTTLGNLKYFSIAVDTKADYSFLAHFMNCPQLANLKFILKCQRSIPEIKLPVIPKAVRTLTLDRCAIDWLFGSYCYANIEKIIFCDAEINFERISKAKICVDDIIFICNEDEQEVPKSVVNFFNHPNPWSVCKRFYIGKLKWDKMKLEGSVLNDHVDTKSEFYVFENEEKGRALDEKSFYQLADIPIHIDFLYFCDFED